jgi:hypothetical protein
MELFFTIVVAILMAFCLRDSWTKSPVKAAFQAAAFIGGALLADFALKFL